MLGFIVHNCLRVCNDITFGRFLFPFVRSRYNLMTLRCSCVSYMGIPICDVHYDFRVKMTFYSPLLSFALMCIHVFFMLFIFIFRIPTRSQFRVVPYVTIWAYKRCSVRLNPQLFVAHDLYMLFVFIPHSDVHVLTVYMNDMVDVL